MILHLLERLLLIIFVIIIGSRPVYNENFAIVKGTIITPEANSGNWFGETQINYPEGFTQNNCIVISIMSTLLGNDNWKTPGASGRAVEATGGNYSSTAILGDDNITARVFKISDGEGTKRIEIKIVLMKLPTGNDAPLLGDVNLDGEITEADKILIPDFIVNGGALTFDQYANADCDPNRDGKINSGDTLQIEKYLNGQIDHL